MTVRALFVLAPFAMFAMPLEQMQLFGVMFAAPAWFALAIMLRRYNRMLWIG